MGIIHNDPPTPGAETGLPPFTVRKDVGMGIIHYGGLVARIECTFHPNCRTVELNLLH